MIKQILSYCLLLIAWSASFCMPLEGMEKGASVQIPMQVPSSPLNRVASLKLLATRAAAAHLNPSRNYNVALDSYINPRKYFPGELDSLLIEPLAAHAAQTLEQLICQQIPVAFTYLGSSGTERGITNYTTRCGQHSLLLMPDPVGDQSAVDESVKFCRRSFISPDKSLYVQYRLKNFLHIFNAENSTLLHQLPLTAVPHASFDQMVALARDNKIITQYKRQAKNNRYITVVYDIETNQIVYGCNGECKQVTADGAYMVLEDKSNCIVYDTQTGLPLHIPQRPYREVLVIAQSGKLVATHHDDKNDFDTYGTFYVYDLAGKKLHALSKPEQKGWWAIKNYMASNDGSRVAIVYCDAGMKDTHWFSKARVLVWSLTTGQCIANLDINVQNKHELKLGGFFVDANQVLVYTDKQWFIWDIKTNACKAQRSTHASYTIKKLQPYRNGDYVIALHKYPLILREYPLFWYATHRLLGKNLSLPELQALLILEHNREHAPEYNAHALKTITESKNSLVQELTKKRYDGKTEYSKRWCSIQ